MKNSFFDNIWFVRIISLVFALFLYAFVSSENSDQFQAISNQQFASIETSETISNVPVYLGEHDEDAFVSELPESVTVKLSGPRNIIAQVTIEDFIVQTEDIRGISTGRQTIRLIATGLPEEVDYQISPIRHVVQISRRETITVPVEYLIDENLVPEGYEVGEVNLSPAEVTLTGKAETIAEIEQVVIKISRDVPQTENFIQTYRLQILNSEGQLLDINASATEIDADVEVRPLIKEVGLTVVPTGENSETYDYTYELMGQTAVEIQANQTVLDQLATINIMVDVSTLTESQTIIGFLQLPDNIVQSNINQIEVLVSLSPLMTEEATSSEMSEVSQESESVLDTTTPDVSEESSTESSELDETLSESSQSEADSPE